MSLLAVTQPQFGGRRAGYGGRIDSLISIAVLDVIEHGQYEAVFLFGFRTRIDGHDVDVFVLSICSPFLVLFFRIDVEFILAFDIFDILGHFGEVWCEGRPFLLRLDAPDLDGAGFDGRAGDEWSGRVPFDYCVLFASFEDLE